VNIFGSVSEIVGAIVTGNILSALEGVKELAALDDLLQTP
jgi:hypothetical protein